jgi:hypothetical protein
VQNHWSVDQLLSQFRKTQKIVASGVALARFNRVGSTLRQEPVWVAE